MNLVLADDHELIRTGIKHILNSIRGFKVIAEAEDGETAVKICRKTHPDAVLMDMQMPGIDGLEATKKITRYCPDTKVIILSVFAQAPLPKKVMQAGAHGYLTKGAAPEEMIVALRQVIAGQRYLSPQIAQQMALNQIVASEVNPLDSLSERELQIMMMIIHGKRVQDIATELLLSSKTINTYRYRLFQKLNVQSDVELTHLAIRYGMLDTKMI